MYIAGTSSAYVMRSRAAISRKARALNAGISTVQPPTRSMVRMIATSPVTCEAGTASTDTSPSRSAMPCSKCSSEWMVPRWVSIAPFGRPVVPEV